MQVPRSDVRCTFPAWPSSRTSLPTAGTTCLPSVEATDTRQPQMCLPVPNRKRIVRPEIHEYNSLARHLRSSLLRDPIDFFPLLLPLDFPALTVVCPHRASPKPLLSLFLTEHGRGRAGKSLRQAAVLREIYLPATIGHFLTTLAIVTTHLFTLPSTDFSPSLLHPPLPYSSSFLSANSPTPPNHAVPDPIIFYLSRPRYTSISRKRYLVQQPLPSPIIPAPKSLFQFPIPEPTVRVEQTRPKSPLHPRQGLLSPKYNNTTQLPRRPHIAFPLCSSFPLSPFRSPFF